MSPPLTATVPGGGPVGEEHRAVLASMPGRFRAVDAGGDVALVAGSAEGWTDTVVEIVRGGARGVLVVDAGVDDDPEEIRAAGRAAREAGAVVLVDHPYAMSRAWQRVVPDWRRDLSEVKLLDSTTAVDDRSLMRALLEQLVLVRAVLGPPEQLTVVHRSTSVYQLAGHAGPVRLSLSGTWSPCAALTLDLVGTVRRRRARFVSIGLAAPAQISDFDRLGARIEQPVYESGHRVTWQRLHAAVTAPHDHPGGRDLDQLADDVERVDTLFGRPELEGNLPHDVRDY